MKFLIPVMIMIKTNNNSSIQTVFSFLIIMFNLTLQKTSTVKISYIFMGDTLSFWVTNLSFWLIFMMVFIKTNQTRKYMSLLLSMSLTLVITFFTWNFMLFYMAFEITVVIILTIVMTWGYQPERVEAVVFMIMMTMMVSLPFLVTMMSKKSLNFWFLSTTNKLFDYLGILIIFMMKMPTFFLHIWLPKIHVESPIQGSMILAAILLKLGSYGLMRANNVMKVINSKFNYLMMAFAMYTMIMVSIICIVQTDLKTIIAYSSIVHMTMIFSTIMINKDKGMMGTLLIILGHGMCSSGMFMLANFVYKTVKSRSIMLSAGIMSLMPTTSTLWFILCMGNAPMPPSLNMIGELMCFKSIMNWSLVIWPLILINTLISSFYSIYLFYSLYHGNYSKMQCKFNPMSSKTITLSILHIIPLLILPIKIQTLSI